MSSGASSSKTSILSELSESMDYVTLDKLKGRLKNLENKLDNFEYSESSS